MLLNDLAQVLGKDLCHQFIVPELTSLSEDPLCRVRKATALNLHNACRTVEPHVRCVFVCLTALGDGGKIAAHVLEIGQRRVLGS